MKTILWYALLLLAPLMALSQPAMPEYGKIDKADLLMTDCDFDAGAVAFKLLDYGKVRFMTSKNLDANDFKTRPFGMRSDGPKQLFRIVTEIRIRIKILKNDGIQLANVKIPMYADEKITKSKGCTYNLDNGGNIIVSNIGKDEIYTTKLGDKQSELTMVLNNVKVGSVIEYAYTMDAEDEYYIRNWYFQGKIPVRLSYYDIDLPIAYNFGEEAFINHPSVVKKFKERLEVYNEGPNQLEVPTANRIIYLQNVASNKAEPYMGAAIDYMQRVYYHPVYKHTQDDVKDGVLVLWRKLAQWLGGTVGIDKMVQANIKGSELLLEQVQQLTDTAEKIKRIHSYFIKNMVCTGDRSIYPFETATKVWDNQSGVVADINLVFINLLRKAGIKAMPFIGSTYDNGSVSLPYPSHRQFNILLAYIPTANGYYLLNATDKETLPSLVPQYLLVTKGLVLNGEESDFVDLADNGQQHKQIANVQVTVSANGQATGKAQIKSYEYAKGPRLAAWQHNKEYFKETYLGSSYGPLGIESLVVSNEADDSQPLDQAFDFTLPISNSGNYYYLHTNLFTGIGSNPFTNDERQTDVEFRYYQSYYLNVSITVPDGFVAEDLPKGIHLVLPDNRIDCKREVSINGNVIKLKMALVFNDASFAAKDYGLLKDFYKKLFNLLEEPIVVKKR
jgi:hypothetical protein